MKKLKRIFIFMAVCLLIFSMAGCGKDASAEPTVAISRASLDTVNEGGEISYIVSVIGDKITFDVTPSDIMLNGFTAEITIAEAKGQESGLVITLRNIQDTAGSPEYISIAEGIATAKDGASSSQKSSPAFKIQAN